MKNKYLLFILFCLFLCCISSVNSQVLSSFKGYEWGTDISAMKEIFDLGQPINTSIGFGRSITIYSTNLKFIENVELSSCSFAFYKNRFFQATILASGADNCGRLRDIFVEAYGSDYEYDNSTSDFINVYVWHAKGSIVSFSLTKDASIATINLMSEDLLKEMQKEN